jgi:predicted TIM-barrel fold metal-dependent hydrolase
LIFLEDPRGRVGAVPRLLSRDKIALEEHISSDALNALWDASGEASRNRKECMAWVKTDLSTSKNRLKDMDECRIATTILSMTSSGVQGTADIDQAIASARQTNDHIHDTFVQPHPDRFVFFACVAMQAPEAATTELGRAVSDLGAKAALIKRVHEPRRCRIYHVRGS